MWLKITRITAKAKKYKKKREKKGEVMIAGYCTWTTPIEQHGNTKAKLTLQ